MSPPPCVIRPVFAYAQVRQRGRPSRRSSRTQCRVGVDEFNLAGRRAYERAGFREIGRRHQSIHGFGGRHDEILVDCLASEFESPDLAAVFRPDPPWDTDR